MCMCVRVCVRVWTELRACVCIRVFTHVRVVPCVSVCVRGVDGLCVDGLCVCVRFVCKVCVWVYVY